MRKRRQVNEINVVPYIDVMLVLLVIFMVTAPVLQPATVDLPTVGSAALVSAEPMQVQINANGSLELLDLKARKNSRLTEEELLATLKVLQQNKPELAIIIASDKNVRYEKVMDVMNSLQKSGIERVGLLVNTER